MKLLLDEHLTHELRGLLIGHEVYSVRYMKWDGVRNGSLLANAAAEGFDALITNDGGIAFEQNRATCRAQSYTWARRPMHLKSSSRWSRNC